VLIYTSVWELVYVTVLVKCVQVAELEGKVKQTVASKEKVPDEGRSGDAAGGGMSKPELCKQIMKKLNVM